MDKSVFDGLKFINFGWALVAPSTCRYFADHGATVIKVETHTKSDIARTSTPFYEDIPGLNRSMFFGKHNANTLSVTINLKLPKGRELAWRLIKWADIVLESFTPGIMKKLGLDYDSVKPVRPDIIYVSTCLQGQDGPHANYSGFGSLIAALGGFAEVSGWPDRECSPPYGAYSDYICPRFLSTAIIAALEYRRRTGKGQRISQSQFETSLHFLSPLIMDYDVNGRIAGRNGNHLPDAAPHGVYPCKGDDQWIAIAISTDEEWQSFCKAIGEPPWTREPKLATLSGRKEHEDELEELVAQWTINYTSKEIEALMQTANVPAHNVAKSSDLFEDQQLEHRNYFVRLNHPEMGNPAFEQIVNFILSKTPRKIIKPSPCLGEHNEYVFKELLGLTDDEIADHIISSSITTEVPEGTGIDVGV